MGDSKTPAHLPTCLKTLETLGQNEWATDRDLAELTGLAVDQVRGALNGAVDRGKYEGVLERSGRPGDWSYRLIGPIDWSTVGSRAGSKNAYKAVHLHKTALEWMQSRNSRSAFTQGQVMKALNITAGQVRPMMGRLVTQGKVIPLSPESWRLADDVPLVPATVKKSEPVVRPDHFVQEAPIQKALVVEQFDTTQVVGPVISVGPPLPKTDLSLSDALHMLQKPKRTMDECVKDALEAIADGETFSVQRMQQMLPLILTFQEAAKRLYKQIHNIVD